MVDTPEPVARYLELGLRLGRHLDGLVDAYYGPAELAARVDAEPVLPIGQLRDDVARLIADLDGGAGDLDAARRRWLRGQLVGLHAVARKLAGEDISYVEEVETCYCVTPTLVPEEELAAAHDTLAEVLPGTGDLRDRFVAWRESHAIGVGTLRAVIDSLADDFRDRTRQAFGLPEG